MSTSRLSWSHIAANRALAVACLAAGGALAGTAVQAESAARTFASVAPSRSYSVGSTLPLPPSRVELDVKPSPALISLDRMTIVGHVAAPRATLLPTACVPGWRELLEGPAGRRVFESCGTRDAAGAVTAGLARTAGAERLIAPKSRHDRLIDWNRAEEGSKAPPLVIGAPSVPVSE